MEDGIYLAKSNTDINSFSFYPANTDNILVYVFNNNIYLFGDENCFSIELFSEYRKVIDLSTSQYIN